MKHLILSITMLFGLSAFAAPGVNVGDHLSVLDILPVAAVTSSGNGTGVDLQQYAGQVAIVLDAHNVAGTTPTMDVKVQDSADNSSFADISPSVAFTQVTTTDSVQKLVVNKDNLRRYIRVVKTIGGTSSPQYLLSAKAYAIKKYPQ
jgi:hypothetical protein